MELCWWAVRIRPQQRTVCGARYDDPAKAPFLIERLLQRRGFETFLPRRTVFRHSNGITAKKRQKREVPRPLMVGWIFVGWPVGENRWRELFDCPGVVAVAGSGGRPVRVPGAAMAALAKRLGGGLVAAPRPERFMRSHAEFGPGDVVKVMADGPFEGLASKVVDVRHGQAKILLSLLGTQREVWMDTWLLQPAHEQAA